MIVWQTPLKLTYDVSSEGTHVKQAILPSHSGLKLDEKAVVNVLREAMFADGDWAQLCLQLIDAAALKTIEANHPCDVSRCIIDTISQWLRSDPNASWEKLAATVAHVEGYGEATAHIIRRKAGIVHTCMFYVR